MTTDSDRIFPPPLIAVNEPFVTEAAADKDHELLEESDEIDGGDFKAVLDFRAATLSVLRVGANDVAAAGDGQHFVETARFVIGQSSTISIVPAASAGGEETVLVCSPAEDLGGRLEHYSANGALLFERRWTDRHPRSAVASPRFLGRRFIAIDVMTRELSYAVLIVDADDLARDVLALPAPDTAWRDPSVSSPQFFVTLDGTLMLSASFRDGNGPTSYRLYAFDRAAGTFAHALTLDHTALGLDRDALQHYADTTRFVDGRLLFLRSHSRANFSNVVVRIVRADQSDESAGWRLGDIARIQLSLSTSIALRVAPCGRLLIVLEQPRDFGIAWVEHLYSVHDVVTAADGARVDSVGEWGQNALPPALEFGMPTRQSIAGMRFSDVEDGHCRTDADAPLVVSAPRWYGSRRERICRFFRRVAGTLVATHQLSRADLDEDGVRSMRIANHDRVVIELNSGDERVFALPDASLCDGDTEDDRRDRAARQAAREQQHQRRVREVAARRQQQEQQQEQQQLGGE